MQFYLIYCVGFNGGKFRTIINVCFSTRGGTSSLIVLFLPGQDDNLVWVEAGNVKAEKNAKNTTDRAFHFVYGHLRKAKAE